MGTAGLIAHFNAAAVEIDENGKRPFVGQIQIQPLIAGINDILDNAHDDRILPFFIIVKDQGGLSIKKASCLKKMESAHIF